MHSRNIFAEAAPAYWAAGIPVIPLRESQKRPVTHAWTSYSKSLPSAELQSQWLTQYPNGNIGLVLGPQAGVLVIDIDSDDQSVVSAISDVLSPFASPWKRIGKKGMVLAYRWNGIQTFRIKGPDNSTLVELLSTGTQVVLPPSIHPDTRRPYTANTELLTVLKSLEELPHDIEERLRIRLHEIGVLQAPAHPIGKKSGGGNSLDEALAEARSFDRKIEDGRNEIGTRIRGRIFATLKADDLLTLDSFTTQSWLAFNQECAIEPTTLSSNEYSFEWWSNVCRSDFNRLKKKQASKGRLINDVPPHWSEEIVSLEAGNAALDAGIKSFFSDADGHIKSAMDAPVHLIRITAGAGKTTNVASQLGAWLRDRPGTVAHVYTDTLKLADAFKEDIECANPDITAMVVSGLIKAGCKRPELLEQVAKQGLPVRATCCESPATNSAKAVLAELGRSEDIARQEFSTISRCPFFAECPAQLRFDRTYRVYVFPHNFLTRKLDERIPLASINVIDEAFIAKTLLRETLAPSEIEEHQFGKSMVAELRATQFLTMSFLNGLGMTPQLLRNYAKTIRGSWHSRTKGIEPGDALIEVRVQSIPPAPRFSHFCEVLADEMESGRDKVYALTRRLETAHGEHGDEDRETIVMRWRDKIRLKVPTLILDATGNVEILRILFPQIRSTQINIKRNAEVIQVFDNSFSLSGFERDKKRGTLLQRTTNVIARIAEAIGTGLLITYKRYEPTIPVPEGWRIEHFGNIRGRNDFASHDAVIIIGRNLPSDHSVEDMAAGLLYGTSHEADFTGKEKVRRGYRLKNDKTAGIELSMWKDPLLQAISEQVCEQETVQALDRLRLLRCDKPKLVILMCSLPVDVEVDTLIHLNGLAQMTRLDQAQNRIGGVLPLRDEFLVEKYPDLFESVDVAKRALKEEREVMGVLSLSNTLSQNAPIIFRYRTLGQRGPRSSKARTLGERNVFAVLDNLQTLHGLDVTLYGKRFLERPQTVPQWMWDLEGRSFFLFNMAFEDENELPSVALVSSIAPGEQPSDDPHQP